MEIIPTGGALGAEIRGIDVGSPLLPSEVALLREAVLEHLLVVFREQRLTDEAHVRFSRYFGQPEPHVRPRSEADSSLREIFVVSNVSDNGRPLGALGNGELTFHSDLSYLSRPGSLSIVHAVEVPLSGGDTQWANAYAAYDALPTDLREHALSLRAIHRHSEQAQNPKTPASHPVVRTHPETKRRATYVSPQFTRSIVGLPCDEGDALLDRLLRHVTQPEFVWTHKWRAGDVVIWDNRCTMHRREAFDPTARRILKRTQMFGDAPYLDL